ncbi:MAG: hypothetical protein ACRD51_01690, partial [Candidatus Acidiferrum sp.]
ANHLWLAPARAGIRNKAWAGSWFERAHERKAPADRVREVIRSKEKGIKKVERKNRRVHAMSNQGPNTFVEEFRERLNREDLERRWKLEALDSLYTESQEQPESFRRLWVKPLMAAGLSLESAFELLIEARFRPN